MPVPNFIGVVFYQAYEEATTSEAFKKGRAVSEEVCYFLAFTKRLLFAKS